MLRYFASVFFLLYLFSLKATAVTGYPPADSLPEKKRRLIAGLPVVFYTPETRFGFGLSGVCIFNFKNDSLNARRSSLSLGFAYTQNRQVLSYLPFNLFLRNRLYQVYGELGYNNYNYDFYGVGNNMPAAYVERYGVEFPRLRLTVLKNIKGPFFAGIRYAYDKFTLFDLAEGGELASGRIGGSGGGTVSGGGLVFMFDSRDHIFFPSRGMWSELVLYRDSRFTGSSFNYTRIAFDFSKYVSLSANDIVALNLYTIYADTDLPFFQMGMLGGTKKMRGFYEGRYRDNNAFVLQAEYRRHLFWQLGLSVFGSAGQVARRYGLFHHSNWRYTCGAGLRLMADRSQRINLRFDVALGNRQLLTYFTIGEAF